LTSESLRAGAINEKAIRNALTTSRGDIFVASGMLAVAPRELDRYIRASEELQGFTAAIATVKKNVDYDRMSIEQFREELDNLTRSYRLEALNVIHELATMPFNDSAAMAEVKLKAAVQLRGAHSDAPINSDQQQVLSDLNQLYQQSAPRIKSIRAAIEVEYHQPGPDQAKALEP
jgi:hypothetical protein